MDAKTIYNVLRPQLEKMEEKEKRSLSKLIAGKSGKSKYKRLILSAKEAKDKIKLYRLVEIQREQQKLI